MLFRSGVAIALAENDEIVLRAAAGTVCPDPDTRIDRDSAFSGACFRTAQVINCNDTETDSRVNVQACRGMGVRSMVAVPLCGRRRVIGILEAFSCWPFAFNEIDVRNLTLLAELIPGALKPEDEDHFTQSAQAAATGLAKPKPAPPKVEAKPAPVVPSARALPPLRVPRAPSPVQPAMPARLTVPSSPTAPIAPYAASMKPAAPLPAPKRVAAAAPIAVAAPRPVRVRPVDARAPAAAPAYRARKAEPAPTPVFGQDDEKSRPPWIVFMLVCVLIATAFGAGVWWKLRTAPIGDRMPENQTGVQDFKSDMMLGQSQHGGADLHALVASPYDKVFFCRRNIHISLFGLILFLN